jgi:hypothetical protein
MPGYVKAKLNICQNMYKEGYIYMPGYVYARINICQDMYKKCFIYAKICIRKANVSLICISYA